MTDAELLHAYATTESQTAFRQLLERHERLVYTAALRQTAGQAHLARDVSQLVFVQLARKAASLVYHPKISGWLYTCSLYTAAKLMRAERRRDIRESKAPPLLEGSEIVVDWEKVRPLLKIIMRELRKEDRVAMYSRFFQNQSLAEVGNALGVSEDAARRRVDRALEKARRLLYKRGIKTAAGALGVALANHPLRAAPNALLGKVVLAPPSISVAAGGAGNSTFWISAIRTLTFMQKIKLSVGAVTLLGAAWIGASLEKHYTTRQLSADLEAQLQSQGRKISELREENDRLAKVLAQLNAKPSDAGTSILYPRTDSPSGPLSRLRILAELQKAKVVSANVSAIDKTAGKLTDGFADLFGLSSDEREKLQRALDKAKDELGELERHNATVTKDGSNKFVVSVQPFAAQGGRLYDETMNSFAMVLGPERNAAFVALGSANEIEESFGRFGAESRTLTVSFEPTAESPFQLADQVQMPGNYTTTRSYGFESLDEAKHGLGGLAQLVPPEFGAKK